MRIFAEDVHSSALDIEQFRYVLVTVQAVRDKKWNDDYIWRIGQLVPLRDQWRFFHVCVRDGSEFAARTNSFRFSVGPALGAISWARANNNSVTSGLLPTGWQ